MVRVVVILGPPGSGKSTTGEALGRLGLRWREWEDAILKRWGTRDAFVANKREALPALHHEIRSWINLDGAPAAIETTGLSDAAFLDGLQREGGCFVVRLDVSEETALERIAARESGRHLSDEMEVNRAVYRAVRDLVVPKRRADLRIDTETTSAEEAARLIVASMPD